MALRDFEYMPQGSANLLVHGVLEIDGHPRHRGWKVVVDPSAIRSDRVAGRS
jgi:hypothetical protein